MPLPRSSIRRHGNVERPFRGALLQFKKASAALEKALAKKSTRPSDRVLLESVRADLNRVSVLTQEMLAKLFDHIGTAPTIHPPPSKLPPQSKPDPELTESLRRAFAKLEAAKQANQPKSEH